MSTVCSGEKEGNFPQEHISNYLFMNWWTGRPPIERQEHAVCCRQLQNSQLIVLLFSVITPAIQLGFGSRKFRHQVKVVLSLLLTGIKIYMYVLIWRNHWATAWETAAAVFVSWSVREWQGVAMGVEQVEGENIWYWSHQFTIASPKFIAQDALECWLIQSKRHKGVMSSNLTWLEVDNGSQFQKLPCKSMHVYSEFK